MALISYVKTIANKRLLIYESRRFKSMYTLQGKTWPIWYVRFPRQFMYAQRTLPAGGPRTWQAFTSPQQCWTNPTAPEKKSSRHNPQPSWVICWSATQFLFQHSYWSSNESQTSVDSRLLGLPGPYHQRMIGMFNTYSRGLTHRSLTDTCGDYNLAGASLPTPPPTFPTRRSVLMQLECQPVPIDLMPN
jgi:hypothetical protein